MDWIVVLKNGTRVLYEYQPRRGISLARVGSPAFPCNKVFYNDSHNFTSPPGILLQ